MHKENFLPKSVQSAEKGLVFNIQRFSLHDGPGIRTTVFLKGCPLKCLWCSNPESQNHQPNLIVRDIECKQCGACVEACPMGAIKLNRAKNREINWKICNQCLLCVDACIYNSLNICGRYMGIRELLDEVLRDMPFYKNSGGGVTISGGEPLAQIEFTARLLKAFKEKGLHTALDTCGYAPWSDISRILAFADLLLWDIKHLDNEQHKRFTGVGNRQILENLERAAKTARLWLRLPLIAEFNDSVEYIKGIAILSKRIGAEKISLLPYHKGGESKIHQIGRSYLFNEAKAPTDEHIDVLKEIIELEGVRVSVGN
jgi:pyruvate formate lyase activating enzyme